MILDVDPDDDDVVYYYPELCSPLQPSLPGKKKQKKGLFWSRINKTALPSLE